VPSARVGQGHSFVELGQFVLHEVPMKLLQRSIRRRSRARLRAWTGLLTAQSRAVVASHAPMALQVPRRLSLKSLPNARYWITRKALIPNEMLRQVSPRDGACVPWPAERRAAVYARSQ